MTQLEMYKFFLKNQKELASEYLGKYVVLVEDKVVASYNSSIEAYRDAVEKYKVGSYIIQHCQNPSSSFIRPRIIVEMLNAETLEAIKESESGRCERFSTIEEYKKAFS